MRIVQAIACKPGRAYAVDGDVDDIGGNDGVNGSGDQPNDIGDEESNLVDGFGNLSLESNLVELIDDDALACDADVDVECECPFACMCDVAMMVEEVNDTSSGSAAAPATDGNQPNILNDIYFPPPDGEAVAAEQMEAQQIIDTRFNRIQIHIYAFATFADRYGVGRNQSLTYATCILIARDSRPSTDGDWVLTKTGPWDVAYTPNKADASYMFTQQTSLYTDSSRFKEFDSIQYVDGIDGEIRKLYNFAIELTAEEASIVHRQPETDDPRDPQYAWMGFCKVSNLRDRPLAGDLIPRVNAAIDKLRNPEFNSPLVPWAPTSDLPVGVRVRVDRRAIVSQVDDAERAYVVDEYDEYRDGPCDMMDAFMQFDLGLSDGAYFETPPEFDPTLSAYQRIVLWAHSIGAPCCQRSRWSECTWSTMVQKSSVT